MLRGVVGKGQEETALAQGELGGWGPGQQLVSRESLP